MRFAAPADGIGILTGVFFLHPVVPAIYTHGEIINIQSAICIQRRGGVKKIKIGGDQYPDDTGWINKYIILAGIPNAGNLGNSADPFQRTGMDDITFEFSPDFE